MIKICDITDYFIMKLKSDSRFSGIDIVMAYPSQEKPSRLIKPVITVSLNNIELSNEAVGDKTKVGKYQVSCNIYAPLKTAKSTVENIFSSVCSAVFDYSMISVSAFPIVYDDLTRCLTLKSTFCFNEQIGFGDENNE